MPKYNEQIQLKIDKIMSEAEHNKLLAHSSAIKRPKSVAISTKQGHKHMMDELQGE